MKKTDHFKAELQNFGSKATASYSKTFLSRESSMSVMREHSEWPEIQQLLTDRGILRSESERETRKAQRDIQAQKVEQDAIALWDAGEKAGAVALAASADPAQIQHAEIRAAAVSVLERAEETRIEDQASKALLPNYIMWAAQEVYPDVVGYESWDDFDIAHDEYFKAVISGLADPRQCHPSFLQRAVAALRANAEHGGMVWAKYQTDGYLDYADIRSAMTSHQRHSQTDYDQLLRAGLSKDAAREAIINADKVK